MRGQWSTDYGMRYHERHLSHGRCLTCPPRFPALGPAVQTRSRSGARVAHKQFRSWGAVSAPALDKAQRPGLPRGWSYARLPSCHGQGTVQFSTLLSVRRCAVLCCAVLYRAAYDSRYGGLLLPVDSCKLCPYETLVVLRCILAVVCCIRIRDVVSITNCNSAHRRLA